MPPLLPTHNTPMLGYPPPSGCPRVTWLCLLDLVSSAMHFYSATPLINSAVSKALLEDPHISARLNVKWGKVLINLVPTSVIEGHPTAHLPATCWQVLLDNNPSPFRHLKVCQLPSWVRQPSLFTLGLSSSLPLSRCATCMPLGPNAMSSSGRTPLPPQPNIRRRHSRRRPALLVPWPCAKVCSLCLQCQCLLYSWQHSRVLLLPSHQRTRHPPLPLLLQSRTLPLCPPLLGTLSTAAPISTWLAIPLTP